MILQSFGWHRGVREWSVVLESLVDSIVHARESGWSQVSGRSGVVDTDNSPMSRSQCPQSQVAAYHSLFWLISVATLSKSGLEQTYYNSEAVFLFISW